MSRYKIEIEREPLSDAEISKHMNFDKFIAGQPATPWLSKAAKLWLSVSAGVIALASTAYVFMGTHHDNKTADLLPVFIDPPVPALRNDPDKFMIRAEKDTSLSYGTGSIIHIPANSFVTQEGHDVKGPVEIRYLEFHDQVDQLLSGIPMHYDSAGTHYQFESAGMFEIMAYQDGEPVFLKENKELSVDMISYSDRNEFNIYYLDTVRRRWLYDERNTIADRENLTDLKKQYEQFIGQKVPESQPVLMPQKANPELENFVIDYNKEEFPELSVYDGIKFEVEKSNKNYKPELANITWDDVLIERHGDQKHYRITFTGGKTSQSFVTVPVIDEKNFESAYRDYESRMKLRRRRLAQRADSINALDAVYTAASARSNGINARFDNYVKSGNIFRTVRVPRLGLWNSNAVIKYQNMFGLEKPMAGFPAAHFREAKGGENLDIRVAYLIRKNVNAICPISYHSFKKFPAELGQKADVLVGITADKRVMYVSGSELRKINLKSADVYFAMHEEKDGKGTIDQIRSMLDL